MGPLVECLGSVHNEQGGSCSLVRRYISAHAGHIRRNVPSGPDAEMEVRAPE